VRRFTEEACPICGCTESWLGPKADALQIFIKLVVAKRPSISVADLMLKIEYQKGAGFVEDITEDEICFVNGDRGLKCAPSPD
jgi:hypothetical protein